MEHIQEFTEISIDVFNIISCFCDIQTTTNLNNSCKTFKRFSKSKNTTNTEYITFKYAIKIKSISLINYLIGCKYMFDPYYYIIDILKTNDYEFITTLFPNPQKKVIDMHLHTIISTLDVSIIKYFYPNNHSEYFYQRLFSYNRLDVINSIIEQSNDENIGTYIASFSYVLYIGNAINKHNSFNSSNTDMLLFLYKNELPPDFSHITNILKTESFPNIKKIFDNLPSKFINEYFENIEDRFIVGNNLLIELQIFLHENNYLTTFYGKQCSKINNINDITDIDPSTINEVMAIYYASIKRFDISDLFIYYNIRNSVNITENLIYYYVKHERSYIFSLEQLKKYDTNEIKIICSLENHNCLFYYYRDPVYFLTNNIQEIIKTNNYKVVKVYSKTHKINISHVYAAKKTNRLRIYNRFIKYKQNIDINVEDRKQVDHLIKINDIRLIDLFLKIFNESSTKLISKHDKNLVRYLSFDLLKVVYRNTQIFSCKTIEHMLKYRSLKVVNFFLENISFAKENLFHAYLNNIRAAEYVLSKLSRVCLVDLNNDCNRIIKKETPSMLKFSEWIITKNPDVSQYSLHDCVYTKNIVFFKYLIENHDHEVTDKVIIHIIGERRIEFLHYLGSINLLPNPFCAYRNIDPIPLNEDSIDTIANNMYYIILEHPCQNSPSFIPSKKILREFVKIFIKYTLENNNKKVSDFIHCNKYSPSPCCSLPHEDYLTDSSDDSSDNISHTNMYDSDTGYYNTIDDDLGYDNF